ncbi:MAG TPA: flippase activity-associated protein Agl23 [Longilinea sp.]|nr:flippase activity-associated protein Agl23 [Longilinea sp.]
MIQTDQTPTILDKPVSQYLPKFNLETLLAILIIVAAIVSRFAMLGERVMAHDEVNHVVPSYELYTGSGYHHDPMTHGPFQFHIIALTYFLFGDNDFTSRIPAAVFSISAIIFVLFGYRRYLGRTGALIAGLLFLISPFMLFYGRYARNEGFIEFIGVMLIYGALRYMDKGDKVALFLVTGATIFHFVVKETAFLFTAIFLLLFLAIFLLNLRHQDWRSTAAKRKVVRSLIAMIIYAAITLAAVVILRITSGGTTSLPAFLQFFINPLTGSVQATTPLGSLIAISPIQILYVIGLIITFLYLGKFVSAMTKGMGQASPNARRSFDMIVVVTSLILPLLSAFLITLMGWDPLDYISGMPRIAFFLGLTFLFSAWIGFNWNISEWLKHAAIFYSVFIVLYTTFFTNGQGFFTGIIGSLGYWLSQQAVQRGNQPWYYYAGLELPIYEFLAIFGCILAFVYGIKHKLFSAPAGIEPTVLAKTNAESKSSEAVLHKLNIKEDNASIVDVVTAPVKVPILGLLLSWSLLALIAYSYAGEKMPWLAVHIALPMLLASGWGLGFLVDSTDWKRLKENNAWLGLLLVPIFLAGLIFTVTGLLGNDPPFQGNTLAQLNTTSSFLFALIALCGGGFGLFYFFHDWPFRQTFRFILMFFFAFMAVLTARAAYQSSFINYNYATEFLVYAHAADGPKEILAQIEEISRRVTGGLDIAVAYDNDGLYPYWWYLREYPNSRFYGGEPTRDLEDVPLIISSEATWDRLAPLVRNNYIYFEYQRLWWPIEDYNNMTWQRLWDAVSDPEMRTAIFDIWLNRDYTLYGTLTGNMHLTLTTWQPSNRIRLYIRNDIVSQMWNLGVPPTAAVIADVDPYADTMIEIMPDAVLGQTTSETPEFNGPRGIAAGADGSIYIADTFNSRIVHYSADGELLQSWGSFADAAAGAAPGGTFNEPWGIAVGPDGSVYVTDTWNYRIQRFTADGEFITMWGTSGIGDTPTGFYGPRGIYVDAAGQVFVTDTGNKRVVVFDSNGTYITQFGSAGMELGYFDEPVGITGDANGFIYVADTWNYRIQVFGPSEDGLTYTAITSWDVYGWSSESIDNKPFLTIGPNGNLYTVDPTSFRVLEFTPLGEFVTGWGYYSPNMDGFGLPAAVTVDNEGRVWVSDAVNNYILRFTLPTE